MTIPSALSRRGDERSGAPADGPASPRAERRRRITEAGAGGLPLSRRLVIGTASVLFILVLWQVLAVAGVLNTLFASSPAAIVAAGVKHIQNGTLLRALGQSGWLFLVGFGIAAVVGVVGGIVVGWYALVRAAAEPWINILNATPRIALIPLIILWLGVGFLGKAFLVFLLAVFPILINVSAGIAVADRHLVTVARSFLGSNIDVLRHVAIPGAVPHLVSGLRQGLAQSLVGVVVAEYLLGSDGVGGLILNAGANLDSATVFVGIIAVAVIALIINALLRRVERRVDHWR